MVVSAFSLSTIEAEASKLPNLKEFEVRFIKRVNSRTARGTQTACIQSKQKRKKGRKQTSKKEIQIESTQQREEQRPTDR